MRAPHVFISYDGSDLRANGLAGRLRRRGAVVVMAPLAAIAFDSERPHGLAMPGFEHRLPDAVLVRSIAAGSFEAVTRRLGVLHALSRLGVPVWNSAQAIERFIFINANRFIRRVPTRGDNRKTEFAQKQMMQRRAGKHCAEIRIFGGDG